MLEAVPHDLGDPELDVISAISLPTKPGHN
jgi:hypothetical protein